MGKSVAGPGVGRAGRQGEGGRATAGEAAEILTAPARAQTYDPAYPVCLQVYQGWNDYYFECGYTSLAQCNMSASGRAAQCIVNPYYAGPKASPGRRDRRNRRVY